MVIEIVSEFFGVTFVISYVFKRWIITFHFSEQFFNFSTGCVLVYRFSFTFKSFITQEFYTLFYLLGSLLVFLGAFCEIRSFFKKYVETFVVFEIFFGFKAFFFLWKSLSCSWRKWVNQIFGSGRCIGCFIFAHPQFCIKIGGKSFAYSRIIKF